MTARYPVTLDVEGRRCVVLGGGELALHKVAALLDSGAAVIVVSAAICPELRRLADRGAIETVERAPLPGDLKGAFLAVDTTGDEDVNRNSWQEAESAGVILNVLDRPEYCHFAAPAIVNRGPLKIAVSTSGESPFLASSVRSRLERTLGEEWGPFVALVGRIRRQLRAQEMTLDEQVRIYRRLLQSKIRVLLAAGDVEAAEFEGAAICGTGSEGTLRPGRVTLVGAGPGDPGLLTLRGREVLECADVVFHDALVEPSVLALCGSGAILTDVGKRAGRDNPDQDDIVARMIEAAGAGLAVVRLKGGDPFIFGRGGEEVTALMAAGIDVVVVPGVSSAAAAPAAAGIPLTLRGVASSVGFITARTGAAGGGRASLETLAGAVDTLVVLMPLAGLDGLAARLASVLGPEHPAALVCSATMPGQLVVRGTLATIAQASQNAGAAPPATLIVGTVAAEGETAGASHISDSRTG